MFQNFKLNFKLLLGLFAFIPLLLGSVIISIDLVNNGKDNVEDITHRYMVSIAAYAQENLDYYKLEEGQSDYLCMDNLIEEAKDRGVTGVESSYVYVVDGHTGIMLYHPTEEKIGNPVENDAVKHLLDEIASDNYPEPSVITYKYKGEEKYAAYAIGDNGDYIVVVSADKSEILSDANKMQRNAIFISIAVLLIFQIVAMVIATKINKPLNQVAEALKSTAEGDLNANTDITSILSETNELVDSAKILQDKLQKIIGETKDISKKLSIGAELVNNTANNSSESISQINQAIDDIAQGATSVASNVQNINTEVEAMGSVVDNISKTTKNLVSLSNDIKTANNESKTCIDKVSKSSKQSITAVEDISKQIQETNRAVLNVQEAVNMIQSVASQTKLLALNASIEAARAGEAGRGFAVVADEIGSLSAQSNESATQIDTIVRNIIDQSSRSVQLSGNVVNIINEEQGYITEAQQKFDVLNTNIEKSLNEIKTISNQTSDINNSKEVITNSILDLSAISEENAASTEQVAASVGSVLESIENIKKNSIDTNNVSKELTNTVTYFN